MANPESKKLAIDVIARVDKLEKEMRKAKGITSKSFGDMERRGRQFQSKMAGIGKAAFAGFAAGIVAGGVTGLVTQFRQVAASIATIGDQAKQAGISAREFQVLGYIAEQNRIETNDLSAAIREMQLRMDEFVISAGKSGSAAEALQRLGYSVSDIERKLKNPLALFTELVGRVEKFDRAAQIRLFDEVFGGDGERLIRILDDGEAGIRRMAEEADRLGVVMSDEVIAKAEELDRKFAAITTTVSTGLKTAIVEAAGALQSFIDSFNSMWAENQRRINAAELGRMAGEMVGNVPPRAGPAPTRTTPKTDRLPATPWTPPPYTPPSTGGGGGRDKAAAAAEREAEAVKRLIADLEHELALVGATNLQREVANALRDAGAAATAEQQAKITSLVTALHAEEEATRKATEAAEELRSLGQDVLGGIISDLRNGTDAADALSNALGRVGDRLLDMALSSIFGGFRIPGFAKGTNYAPGGLAVVGEKGPELVNLPRGAQVIPNHQIRAPRIQNAAPAPASNTAINISINAPGADAAALARVEASVKDLSKSIPAMVDKRVDSRHFRKTRA